LPSLSGRKGISRAAIAGMRMIVVSQGNCSSMIRINTYRRADNILSNCGDHYSLIFLGSARILSMDASVNGSQEPSLKKVLESGQFVGSPVK
jgi:hypothetical protein